MSENNSNNSRRNNSRNSRNNANNSRNNGRSNNVGHDIGNNRFITPLWALGSRFGGPNPRRITWFDREELNRQPFLNVLLHKPCFAPEYVDFPLPENFVHLKEIALEELQFDFLCRSSELQFFAEHRTKIGTTTSSMVNVQYVELQAWNFGRFRDDWLRMSPRRRAQAAVVEVFWRPNSRRALRRLREEAEELEQDMECFGTEEAEEAVDTPEEDADVDDMDVDDMDEGYAGGGYGSVSDE